jgi:hypothetical protein
MDHVIKAMTQDIGDTGQINIQKEFLRHFLLLRIKISKLDILLNFTRIAGFKFATLPILFGIVSDLVRMCRENSALRLTGKNLLIAQPRMGNRSSSRSTAALHK